MIHLYLFVSLFVAFEYQIDDRGYEYYSPIIDNNLFRPLGWTKPNRAPRYELIATIISENYTKAYIKEVRYGRDYFVGVGDNVGSSVVEEIQRGMVRLDGEEIKGDTFGFINTAGRKRSNTRKGKSTSVSSETDTKDTKNEK